MSKRIWVVESTCEETKQIFEDWVPAVSAEVAEAEVAKVRDYATVIDGSPPLEDYLTVLREKAAKAEGALADINAIQERWDQIVEEESELWDAGLGRLPDGKLVALDGEEGDRCRVCDKIFVPAGDSWDGLDPECADEVSEAMDDLDVGQDEAIKMARRKRGK